jgi:hypothetical protein
MFETIAVLAGLAGLLGLLNFMAKERVPAGTGPVLKPFEFAEGSAGPTVVALAPRTLQELGVDGSIAKEMELTLRLFGHTRGEQVVGFSFLTPEGTPCALRLSNFPAESSAERAA